MQLSHHKSPWIPRLYAGRIAATCQKENGSGNWCAAFSLVEVILALGVVSFAVMAILGLLPTGLSTLRASMNQTVEAQIVRSIGAQAVITPFNDLTSQSYFTDEGLPTNAANAYYTVNVTPEAPVFPGSANGDEITNSLAALEIEIIARPNPAAPGKTNFYSLQVANAGK